MKLCVSNGIRSKRITRESLVTEFRLWEDAGSATPVTDRILTGLFYLRYKEKYRLFPPSALHHDSVREDVQNMARFLSQFMADDPTLAPYVIEYFFTERNFTNIQTATFCNPKILRGWGAIEKASKLRFKFGVGEQAEFRADTKTYGVVRV